MPYIYTPDALTYDGASNTWTLRADYDPQIHRVWIEFSDDDIYFDGDIGANEIGIDTNQTAVVTAYDGTPIASGRVYDEEFYQVQAPDTTTIDIDRVEIAGQPVGYIVSAPLDPGLSYPQTKTSDVGVNPEVDNRLLYDEISSIPCFVAGTNVMTAEGMVPVDWLRPGDRLLTRDRGFQPLLWFGRFDPAAALAAEPDPALLSRFVPVTIAPGALGPGLPSTTLRVSPQHRLLIHDTQLQLCFGHEAMFCAAGFLTGWPGITRKTGRGPLAYYHLLLPRHEAVLADGLWTESLFLGDMTLEMVPASGIAELRRRADLADGGHRQTAYPCLKRWEAALLRPPRSEAVTDGTVADRLRV